MCDFGMTLDAFLRLSPAMWHLLLKATVKRGKRRKQVAKDGGEDEEREVIRCRYADETPDGVW